MYWLYNTSLLNLESFLSLVLVSTSFIVDSCIYVNYTVLPFRFFLGPSYSQGHTSLTEDYNTFTPLGVWTQSLGMHSECSVYWDLFKILKRTNKTLSCPFIIS